MCDYFKSLDSQEMRKHPPPIPNIYYVYIYIHFKIPETMKQKKNTEIKKWDSVFFRNGRLCPLSYLSAWTLSDLNLCTHYALTCHFLKRYVHQFGHVLKTLVLQCGSCLLDLKIFLPTYYCSSLSLDTLMIQFNL